MAALGLAVTALAIKGSGATPAPTPPRLSVPLAAPAASGPRVTQPVKLDLPVAWQLTRSRLEGSGPATLTETFRETWTLEIRPGGFFYLKAPRGRVPAYAGDSGTLRGGSPVPATLLVSEHDFARLVGIASEDEASDDDGSSALLPVDGPVALDLRKPAGGGLDVTLAWSDNEHFAIHLELGTLSLF